VSDTSLASRARLCASRTWADDAVVYAGAAARFGDETWDLTALQTSANTVPSTFAVNFSSGMGDGWSLLARELCMTLVDLRTARAAGIVRQRRVKALTIRGRADDLRRMAAFASETGRGMPGTWTPDDADALLRWYGGRTSNQRNLAKMLELVRDLRRFAPLLTVGALGFEPWPAMTQDQVLRQVLGRDAPTRPPGTLTPLLGIKAFIPLVAAARAYVEVFAPDILALHRLLRTKLSELKPGTAADVARWAAVPTNRVPVHTNGSAAGRGVAGEPVWAMVGRLVGISRHSVRSRGGEIIHALVDAGRVYPGLGALTAMVERPDAGVGCWRGPFETTFDINHERAMLRAAAYILVVGLTGMRDSEAQDLRRGAIHDYFGTPALRTRRHKMRHAEPEPISWWVCDLVLTAYRVLEELSEHPDHVMSAIVGVPSPGFGARQAMHSFVAHINATVAATGLAPIPDVAQLSPQVLRETAAYAMGRFTELGDLVVGHLFGHARATTTAAYQRHRPGDSWNLRIREGGIDGTITLLETMATLVDGGDAVIGARAAELRSVALEARATVVADPARARRIAELHARTWHHGTVVSCRFDAGPAVCHRLARQMGVADPEPGPLHDLCVGQRCTNAHYTTLHLPGLRERRADTAERIAAAPAGSVAAHQLAGDLAEIDGVIAELEGKR